MMIALRAILGQRGRRRIDRLKLGLIAPSQAFSEGQTARELYANSRRGALDLLSGMVRFVDLRVGRGRVREWLPLLVFDDSCCRGARANAHIADLDSAFAHLNNC